MNTDEQEERAREIQKWSLLRRNERKAAMLDHNGNPLRPARSQAEITALYQRNIQIILTITNVCIAALTCLKVFGIL
jgi:hypothetical protein